MQDLSSPVERNISSGFHSCFNQHTHTQKRERDKEEKKTTTVGAERVELPPKSWFLRELCF